VGSPRFGEGEGEREREREGERESEKVRASSFTTQNSRFGLLSITMSRGIVREPPSQGK
jgi:hypothetical protein